MEFFKNRRNAVIITVVLILLSTVYGSHRSLTNEKNKVEDLFFTGVTRLGGGIQTDLQKRLEYSYNLVTISRNYGEEFEQEAEAVGEARTRLANSSSIKDKFEKNNELSMACADLFERMSASNILTDKDSRYKDEVYANLLSRNDTISNEAARFNQKAREFNAGVLGTFPANFLKYPAFVGTIELFA